jgi:hypothetical protein
MQLERLPWQLKLFALAGLACLGSLPGWGQAIEFESGAVTVKTKYNKRIALGSKQSHPSPNLKLAGLAFYTADYISLGTKNLPFNIVGTDPSLGAATTIVPTVIVPLKFVFPNTGSPTLDGTNVVAATENSPIFLTADYTTGGTDLGVTQFGDAIQRGEFWNLPGFSTNYHVLLGTPSVASTVTVVLPPGKGNAFLLLNGGFIGLVDDTFFAQVLNTLLPAYTANQLTIFVTDNVVLAANGQLQNCCTLAFHDSQGPPIATAQTWIFASYTEPGTFVGDVILDVQALSHETAEWLNDPFVGTPLLGGINLIPPAVVPGTAGACIINFETGDPLEAPPVSFTQVTNGTTYHLQDEVFLPWYLHTNPSFSVNGFYTYLNTFPTFSTLCGPG